MGLNILVLSAPAHRLESQGYPGAPNQTRASPHTPTLAQSSGPATLVLNHALRAADSGSRTHAARRPPRVRQGASGAGPAADA